MHHGYMAHIFLDECYQHHPAGYGLHDMMSSDRDIYFTPGEGNPGSDEQRTAANHREVVKALSKLVADIRGHGAVTYRNDDLGYYRIVFKKQTIMKFAIFRWEGFSTSQKRQVMAQALRIIIKRSEDD